MDSLFEKLKENRKIIGNAILFLGIAFLIVANFTEYSWHVAMKNVNPICTAIILVAVLGFQVDFDNLKKDYLLHGVVIINAVSIALFIWGHKDLHVSFILFDLTFGLYLSLKIQLRKIDTYIFIALSAIIAFMLFYWTSENNGFYKGFSANYGGLVLLSGVIFFIQLLEYMKRTVAASNVKNKVILFLKRYRFYFTIVEMLVFAWGYKLISWYRSRTAFLAMIIYGVMLIIPWRVICKKVVYYAIVIGSLVMGLVFPFVYVYAGSEQYAYRYELFYKRIFSDRMIIWPQLLTIFKTFPITGIGTLMMSGSSPYRDGLLDTCSSFVGLAVVYGGIVALLTLALVICVFARMYADLKNCDFGKVGFAGVIACIVASYSESYMTVIPFMMVWLLELVVIRNASIICTDKKIESVYDYLKTLLSSEYGSKLRTSLMSVSLVMFMYYIFGPIESFYANIDELQFDMRTFAPLMSAFAIIIAVSISFIVASLPEKVSSIASAAITGFGIASYIQYMFFNFDLVDKLGNVADADSLGYVYYFSIFIFFAVILIFAIIGSTFKKGNLVICYSAGFVGLIQLIALVSVLVLIVKEPRKGNNIRVFDTSSEFSVASEENIIVLMLDTMGRVNLAKINAEWPEKDDFLHDFTWYDKADSKYVPTHPSLVHMFTDVEREEGMTLKEYEKTAFSEEQVKDFFDAMHDNGYKVELYTEDYLMGPYLDGKFDNIKNVYKRDNIPNILKLMKKQSFYRYLPYCLKPYYSFMDDNTANTYLAEEEIKSYYRNYVFRDAVGEDGISIDETTTKRFAYHHLKGAHSYPNDDENCNRVPDNSVETYVAGAGSLVACKEYCDKLKEIGKYDDSTIIVMADHGGGKDELEPIFFVKKKGEKHDEVAVDHREFTYCQFREFILSLVE